MADYSSGDDQEEQSEQKQGDQKEASDDEKLLETARARFKICEAAEREFRTKALEDLKFSAGDQWHAGDKNSRELDGRPCLVINRMPQFIRQITNDQRQNRPAMKASPVDDKGTVEIAEIMQGLIRHIEYDSGADAAYDTAFDHAVRMGRGFYRAITVYEDDDSFHQKILIKRIRNSLTVYLDPSSTEPDGSDAEYGFVTEALEAREYKDQYPDSEVSTMNDYASLGDSMPDWFPNGGVRIAEYYYKVYKPKRIFLLSNGMSLAEDALPKGKDGKPDFKSVLPDGVTIEKNRVVQVPTVMWCKMNGHEILEQRETVFDKWLPLFVVYGEELDIDGKLELKGVVRDAKDPQRMYNYFASTETETLALAPRAPWVGPEGSFEGHESKWESANRKNHAFLEFVPIPNAPAPMRQEFEAPIQAVTMARSQADQDMKGTTGIYDASLGNRSNENSGVAIQRRALQSQTSNFHFVDNLTRSLRHCGRVLVRAIPKVYDAARAVRIIGDDGEHDIAVINQVFIEGNRPKKISLDVGKYDVTVSSGPSYETKRQEAAAAMLDFIKAYPNAAPIIGDLIAKNMDWPGAQEIADRLKMGLPPQFQKDQKDQAVPPALKAQMDQMSQMVQALTQQLHQATDLISNKKLELESKERMNALDNQTKAAIALAQIDANRGGQILEIEADRIEGGLDRSHDANLTDFQAQQAAAQAAAAPSPSPAGSDGAAPANPTGGNSPGSPME